MSNIKHFKYDIKKLIECVKLHPCIWDRTLEIYKDKAERRSAWEQVFRSLEADYDNLSLEHRRLIEEAIITKWTETRDLFLLALRKKPNYIYPKELKYLLSVYPELSDKSDKSELTDKSVFEIVTTPQGQNRFEISVTTDVNDEEDISIKSENDEEDKIVENRRKIYLRKKFKYSVHKLIQYIKLHPCLWDRRLRRLRTEKRNAWKKIFRVLEKDYDKLSSAEKQVVENSIVAKWEQIQKSYFKNLKFGSNIPEGTPKSNYMYHEQLSFLTPLFPLLKRFKKRNNQSSSFNEKTADVKVTTRIKLSYDEIKKLINLIKVRPLIWNKNCVSFRDKFLRRMAWSEVCTSLIGGFDKMTHAEKKEIERAIITKWTYLRDNFVKTLRLNGELCKNGKKRRYMYYRQLSFLKPLYPELTNSDISHDERSDNEECTTQNHSIIEEIEIHPESNDVSREHDTEDSDYSTTQKRKKSKKEFRIEKQSNEDPISADTEVIQINGSDARVMNEDEAFFASLLPTVVRYTEDERLEFRIKVLSAMQEIRNKNRRRFS